MAGDLAVSMRAAQLCAATFTAMSCPCEVLIETADAQAARRLGAVAAAEAWRIEAKFSRYRPDSIISRINASGGQPMLLDDESASLLDFAARCHELSGGAFDVTSGVLRTGPTGDLR